MKYTEAKLEDTVIEILQNQGFEYVKGEAIQRSPEEILIKEDIKNFLATRYAADEITTSEIETIIRKLEVLPASDLYDSNKAVMKLVSDGFTFKRELHDKKDIHVQLIDYNTIENNNFKIVNQLEIEQNHKRIPDGIIYINGLPLVVFEFKSAIRENATIHDAYVQLTTRYKRDIPELLKYNAFGVISDGVNNKAGSLFAPYEFLYAWRRTENDKKDAQGISSLFTMMEGMFKKERLVDIIHNFILFPDVSKREDKIVCRYPQYYATRLLYKNILKHQKPQGDGKGGTYFGSTGCGKSFTMLFLSRMLMKSPELGSPTLIVITDRTDLDDQLSGQFTNAKGYIGDQVVQSVTSRSDLRAKVQGRNSGGVFLTTIHKFNEDTDLLSERTNVICISDEAHRSQINLDQKITINEEKGTVKKSYGFAKHLHDSLPNATYVGFTGTPVDATLDVFGNVVDSYTMTESVEDEITVRLVYEGRAAKVALKSNILQDIEDYYIAAEADKANEYHIEKSKQQSANMNSILGDPDRLKAVAHDFVEHYEKRVSEGSTVKGKAMFVSSSRYIAYAFYKELVKLRPEWLEVKGIDESEKEGLSKKEADKVKPSERVKLIMTRGKDDPKELYDLLGDKDHRKTLDQQFKKAASNFKIAIVVDMWLTGFDVPFLDTIYIDKPIQKHNLIQTISRVNRKFAGKQKGLIVDYIGIKKSMNEALGTYNGGGDDGNRIDDIALSIKVVKDHLDLLHKFFHKFDASGYFSGENLRQLKTLNNAAEFVLVSEEHKKRFMDMVRRLKNAYDICCGSELITKEERDYTHFYLAIRSIVFKLTKKDAPDTAQMNAKVKEMVAEALQSEGVEEIIKIGGSSNGEEDIFSEDYLEQLSKMKLPNTKIQLLQKLLQKAIGQLSKVNKVQGIDFTKKMTALVEKYNERDGNLFTGEVFDEIADAMTELIYEIKQEFSSGDELGIDFEEKAFYDILKSMAAKYDFVYPEDKTLELAKEIKKVVDDKAEFPDWSKRDDVKSMLKVELIILMDENDYPPVDRDEVYQEVFAQAENFKKNR